MGTNPEAYRAAERRLWEHVGATPDERFVTLPTGGRLRVLELGDGPPFVLLHGGSISGASWAQLAAALPDVRCILVDRPGCGLSDPIVGGRLRDLPAVLDHADRLLGDVLDALELDEAAVGATSYGGFFAFRGAAHRPERVTRIVEYSWPLGAPSEIAPLPARVAGIPGLASLTTRVPMTRGMVKQAFRQFGLRRAVDSGAMDDVMIDWAHALFRHTDTLRNDVRSSPRLFTPIAGQNRAVQFDDTLLAELTMPVHLVWGEDDPNGRAETVGRDLAARLPDADLRVVAGAEHAPWLDDLDTCVEHTRRFLSRP